MVWNGVQASTVLNCNRVYAIRMENEHIGMTWDRVLAEHAGVVQLHCESDGFERNSEKFGAGPLL